MKYIVVVITLLAGGCVTVTEPADRLRATCIAAGNDRVSCTVRSNYIANRQWEREQAKERAKWRKENGFDN